MLPEIKNTNPEVNFQALHYLPVMIEIPHTLPLVFGAEGVPDSSSVLPSLRPADDGNPP